MASGTLSAKAKDCCQTVGLSARLIVAAVAKKRAEIPAAVVRQIEDIQNALITGKRWVSLRGDVDPYRYLLVRLGYIVQDYKAGGENYTCVGVSDEDWAVVMGDSR